MHLPRPVVIAVAGPMYRAALNARTPLRMRRSILECFARLAVVPAGTHVEHITLGGRPCEHVTVGASQRPRAVLYLHGGGYTVGSPRTHRSVAAFLARDTGAVVFCLAYRLAPEHPYPAALDDAVAAFRGLVDEHGYGCARIAVAGDSAGGGLAVAAARVLTDDGLRPAALALLSPWTDPSSDDGLRRRDFVIDSAWTRQNAASYRGDSEPHDPGYAPMHERLDGLPPMLIHCAVAELLQPQILKFAQLARAAGVDVHLVQHPRLWHSGHVLAGTLREATDAVHDLGVFLRAHLDAVPVSPAATTAQPLTVDRGAPGSNGYGQRLPALSGSRSVRVRTTGQDGNVYPDEQQQPQTLDNAGRVILTDISSHAFEHPADRTALTAMRSLPGFEPILKRASGMLRERQYRLAFLASSVRVGERQFPDLHAILDDVTQVLDVRQRPELYVYNDPVAQAVTLGVDKPFIAMSSGLYDVTTHDERRFVIGHETGHVLSGHALYQSLLMHLLNLVGTLGWIPAGGLGLRALIAALREWERKAELSADRAGLLAGQDAEAALRVHMKLAGGGHLDRIDAEAFLTQAGEYEAAGDLRDGVLKLLNTERSSHPFAVIRAAEVRRWVDSGDYHRILDGHYPRRTDDRQQTFGDAAREAGVSYKKRIDESSDPLVAAVRNLGSTVGTAADSLVDWIGRKARGDGAAATGDVPDSSTDQDPPA